MYIEDDNGLLKPRREGSKDFQAGSRQGRPSGSPGLEPRPDEETKDLSAVDRNIAAMRAKCRPRAGADAGKQQQLSKEQREDDKSSKEY